MTGLVTLQAAEQALQTGRYPPSLSTDNAKINRVRENLVYLFVIGTVLSFTGAGIFATTLANSVNVIKSGLDGIARNPSVKIPSLRGVLGEIAQSINQMGDKLRETRNHRDALLDSSPNGIITIDRQGKIVLFNPEAAALTGIGQEQALGCQFTAVGLALPLVALLKQTLEKHPTGDPREEILNRPDGSSLSAAVSTARLYNGESVVGALAVVTDLREKRLLEAQVLRANRLAGLGELAAGVAHEIRNPLTAVKGFSQVLEEELPGDDEKREYTGIIIREVNRLERMVEGLLAFARPAPSRFRMENLAAIMDETLVLVENGAFRRRISVLRDYCRDTRAEVDREQIKQVFLNLLLNSAQAIQGQGSVSIAIKREAEQVSVAIGDTGCGIPQEHLDKLFHPFFTTREQGTGLGLATVHSLLEIHGGKATVNSQPGVGTEFVISLPIHQGGESNGRNEGQNPGSRR